MSIWFDKDFSLAHLAHLGHNTMGAHLGMEFSEVGPDFLAGTMPVDHRTKQPYGLLHGGASVALAETLGSVGAAHVIDHHKYKCVGLEINANHISPARSGLVTGIAKPIHIGKTTQVWEIKIFSEAKKLVCISRLTVAILSNHALETK